MAEKKRKITLHGVWRVFFHLSAWALIAAITYQLASPFGWPLMQTALMSIAAYPICCAVIWYILEFEIDAEVGHSQQGVHDDDFDNPLSLDPAPVISAASGLEMTAKTINTAEGVLDPNNPVGIHSRRPVSFRQPVSIFNER